MFDGKTTARGSRKKGIKSAADIRKLGEAEKIAASWHK